MPEQLLLWVTPKIFPDLAAPTARVAEFFDHYATWFAESSKVVIAFCAGNGDHILDYRGAAHWDDSFDWARYNCYAGPEADVHGHNLDWLRRTREGGEVSGNPYSAGPMFILSEQRLDYTLLDGIYRAFREEGARRGIDLAVLEYLEPGPEFCGSEWKTERHPEAAAESASAGGHDIPGVIDVCTNLTADDRSYAAYPEGFPEGTPTTEFIARQTAAFVEDLGLDGVLLGNQFGLLGFWHPDEAPEPTPERRAGISNFFTRFRAELGDHLVYWMDSYWPAAVEDERWAMDEANYALLDGIICSNFAVIALRDQIVPNLAGKRAIADRQGNGTAILFSVDFVDPWYTYRTYLDDRSMYTFQHRTYHRHGHLSDGLTFFANDTFGHFVMPEPLAETLQVVRDAIR